MYKQLQMLVAIFIVVAASTAQAQQNAPANSGPTPPLVQTRSGAVAAAKPATADPNYVIGPQDVLDVSVWKEAELTRSVPVRPDGKISMPLLNDVQAAGLTPMQLTTQITAGLKKYIADPQVTVVVTQINSQRIYILGEINRAGAFPLLPGMTVLEALSSAGGFTMFANTKKIYVMRKVNGEPQKYPFNYKDVVHGKAPESNVVLQAGDTIVVP